MHRFGYSLITPACRTYQMNLYESFPYVPIRSHTFTRWHHGSQLEPNWNPFQSTTLGSPRSMPPNHFIVKLFTPSTNGPARRQYVHVLFLPSLPLPFPCLAV